MPLPNQADDAAANEEIVATRVAERPATGDATPPVAPIVVGSGRSRGLLMGIIVAAAAIALFSLLAYFTHRD